MYCLVVIISLAVAAPRVSKNCYTLCDLQKSDPANVVPRSCNCSLSAVMETASASTEIPLLDDTGVYFVPAETDQFTPQQFLISNPVIKFNQEINRIKKGSVVKKDSSEESSGRIETYERRKTFIRVGNNDGSQPSSYLDLEIQDVSGNETSVIQGNFIPTFESAEQALVECLDLHILEFSRKYGSVENFNEFWEPRNLQVYEDLSNSDLNDKIKKYCSDTEFLIEQALQDIKRGVPKKKGNFKYVQDDFSKKHETQETVESFDFKTLSALTESTYVRGSQTELPSVLNNSVQLNLLEEHDLENSDRKHESKLETLSSPKLSQNTSSTTDNINYSKSTTITNKAKNAMSDVTIVTPKNTAKAYDTDFDMDTMPSEVILKTINEVKKSNFDLVTSKPILDETAMSPISTSLSDVLSFGETSGINETSFDDEQEDSPDKDIVLNLNTSGVILKTHNEMNISNDEIVTISSLEPTFNETTIIFAPITSLNKEHPLREISSTERSMFEREVKSDDTIGFDLSAISSEVNLKSKIENTSIMNMANNEQILDSMLSFPESTTLQNDRLSLGDLNSSSEKSIIKTQEVEDKSKELALDFVTMPSEVMLKSKNELNISSINTASSGDISHNITIYSTSTTLQNGKVTLEDTNSNSGIPMVEKQGKGKDEIKEIDLDTIPFEFILKSNNKTNETNAKKASNERILNKITLIPASTTSTSGELSLGDISNDSETSKAENEDKGIKLNFVTIPNTKMILNPSNVIFKPHLNVVANESSSNDLKLFTAASTSSQDDQVSLENASDNTKQPTTELPEKHTDGDLELNIMASNAILNTLKVVNTSDLNIADSGSILEDNFKFATTVQEETIFNTSSDNDSAISYISTSPVTTVQTQRRNTLKESEVDIPKIITKECQNNEVQTFVNGSEALPNNDFEHSDATSLQKTIRQVSSDDSKSTDSAAVFDNSYISGNLYFGTRQELVPVHLLQTDSGKINLGIDGHSLCEKFIKSNSKSILLFTLCDCVQQMTKNNSTEFNNK